MADNNNKRKGTKNHKKEDGKFHSKHIKHDPQAESARAVFGRRDESPVPSSKANDAIK